MKPDYRIYYLTSMSFEALKYTVLKSQKKDSILNRWGNLSMEWDKVKKSVKIYCPKDEQDDFPGGSDMPIGYLSEEDGKEYIPYLEKGWGEKDLYECFAASIDEQSLDASQRVQVAIKITNLKQQESDLQKQVQDLQAEVKDLQKGVKNLQKEVNGLKDKV